MVKVNSDLPFTERRIAILGSGSWATALAKMVLCNVPSICWFMRRQEKIDEFIQLGRNPSYLSTTNFDTSRIRFTADINEAVAEADVLIVAVPSPYIGQVFKRLHRSIRTKIVISAVKGMVSEDNLVVTDFIHEKFKVPLEQLGVIAGPCHAEEIALERLSYLTIGCVSRDMARQMASLFTTPFVHTTVSEDVWGLEYSSVMKNIYSIAAGICHGLNYGDNFLAVLSSNAMQEMDRFLLATNPMHRDVCDSAYLGDLIVTCYSRFSRNRQFGAMIAMGYSVRAAQIEMEMVAEGYYGTQCIHLLNERLQVSLPIVDAVYAILYERKSPLLVIQDLTTKLM